MEFSTPDWYRFSRWLHAAYGYLFNFLMSSRPKMNAQAGENIGFEFSSSDGVKEISLQVPKAAFSVLGRAGEFLGRTLGLASDVSDLYDFAVGAYGTKDLPLLEQFGAYRMDSALNTAYNEWLAANSTARNGSLTGTQARSALNHLSARVPGLTQTYGSTEHMMNIVQERRFHYPGVQ